MTDARHDPLQLKARVMACLKAGRLQEANEICEHLNRQEPNNGETLLMLGFIKHRLAQNDVALAYLSRANKLRPDLIDPYVLMGNIHRLGNAPESALACYRNALELQPGNAGILNNIGNTLAAMDQLNEAEANYRMAIRKDPGYAEAYNNLGSVLRRLDRLDDAIAAYRHALRLNPAYPAAHNNLGNALKDKDMLEEAVVSYRRALQYKPDYANAHNNLGTVLKKMQRLEEAVACYLKALDINPQDFTAHFNLGNAYQELDQLDAAVTHYRKTVELTPDHAAAWQYLGVVMQKQGKQAESISCLRQALAADPRNEVVKYLLAAAQGESIPEQAPACYVRDLFDYYSDRFDQHLTADLGYSAPEQLYRAVQETLETATRGLDVLDLGCGTGLCGMLFRDLANTLVGLDLSPGMLAKASARNIYDSLVIGDINNPPLPENPVFDLILAADVFIYVGDLTRVFQACGSRLKPGGLFAFSIESQVDGTGNYHLHPKGRYAHAASYIHELAATAGFGRAKSYPVILRQDRGHPVHGQIHVLRKPDNPAAWPSL